MNRRDLFKVLLGGSASVMALSSGVGIKLHEAKAKCSPSLKYGNPTFPLSDADFNALEKVDVSGKVAVITGASTGIGRAVANELASRGFTVIGTSRTPQDYPVPDNFELWKLDLTIPGSIESFASGVKGKYPQIHLLVLNAGRIFIGKYADSNMKKVQETLDTNLNGHQRLYQLLESALPAGTGDYARVFFTASVADKAYLMESFPLPNAPLFAGPFYYPYNASKSGVARAAQNLHGTLRNTESNITVTAFYPILVRTQIADDPILGNPEDPEISAEAEVFRILVGLGSDPSVVGKAYGQMAELKEPYLTSYVINPDPPSGSFEEVIQLFWVSAVIQEEDRTVRSVRC